jgi:imidazole glycerol-phosphate synthase subunit HisH
MSAPNTQPAEAPLPVGEGLGSGAIAVVDYGAGNVQSVANALEAIGANAELTTDPEFIRTAPGVIVPGVGAAQDTILNLERRGLVEPVLDVIRRDVPYLGICMGMQALMSYSEENGGQPCLDVIPGAVRRFVVGSPVPHMGWNQVRATKRGAGHPILAGIPDGAEFYFVHSYICDPSDETWVIATTDYDGPFPCMLGTGNMIGTQFHPEKSGTFGLRLLENFTRIVAAGGVEQAARAMEHAR